METQRFGTVAQIEVGAMLVGRIANLHGTGPIRRGAEKGRFLYGGSTIVVLMEKGRASLEPMFDEARNTGREIPVKLGQAIGHAPQRP